MTSHDALIIGGGPGGATVAYLLARKGWSVTLLERKAFPRRKVCGEYLSATNMQLLDALGLSEEYAHLAGPEIKQVGLFAGPHAITAPLPQPPSGRWGRALGRDILDTLLLKRALSAGVEVLQPCNVESLARDGETFLCRARSVPDGTPTELHARVVIAAHGSWEPGALPSQPVRLQPSAADLFGFKAHFTNAALAEGLMPLLAFPGGYGGLVRTHGNMVSLSCCVRRDVMEGLKRAEGGSAGAAVFQHILKTCPAMRPSMQSAILVDAWLSAGPIRPGIRSMYQENIFRVGNVAGEAHPVIAEGITMAMQSAWLLAESLPRPADISAQSLAIAGRTYTRQWRTAFAPRIRAAALFAHIAMRPALTRTAAAVIRRIPTTLTWGAVWSGKNTMPAVASTFG